MKNIQYLLAVCFGKGVLFLIRYLYLGNGTALPGYLARKICPEVFPLLCKEAKRVVYITGTNGKTTTTHFLASLFGEEQALYNTSGANFEAGCITSLLKAGRRRKNKTLLFEVDEKILPSLLERRPPELLICLNLFRDQLDRYGEIDLIKSAWRKKIEKLPHHTQLILNGQDPSLAFLGSLFPEKSSYFGLDESEKGSQETLHAADSLLCPSCHTPLLYTTIYFSHLGEYNCPSCIFKSPILHLSSLDYPSPSTLVDRYNTMAAVTAARLLGLKKEEICEKITSFSPAFGRGERVSSQGRELLFLLSKNAVSLNENLSLVKALSQKDQLGAILIALNDNGPDGKDISWIWDAELEGFPSLQTDIWITGTRAYDLALALTHTGEKINRSYNVNPNLKKIAAQALQSCPKGKTLCLLPTYTAMLALRKNLLGTKIL